MLLRLMMERVIIVSDLFKDFSNENNLKKIQLGITLLLVLFLSVTGATYAYFAVSATNTETITGEAATVNLTLNVTKIFPASGNSNTGVMVPQKSVSGSNTSPLSTALKNGCVDGNKNVVCQVYQINIKNDGGTATQVVDGMISFYSNSSMTTGIEGTMPNLKYKLITSVDATTPGNSMLGTNADLAAMGTDAKFATNVSLATSAEQNYYMIVWINETNTDQADKSLVNSKKHFYGKVTFDSSNGTGVTSTFDS